MDDDLKDRIRKTLTWIKQGKEKTEKVISARRSNEIPKIVGLALDAVRSAITLAYPNASEDRDKLVTKVEGWGDETDQSALEKLLDVRRTEKQTFLNKTAEITSHYIYVNKKLPLNRDSKQVAQEILGDVADPFLGSVIRDVTVAIDSHLARRTRREGTAHGMAGVTESSTSMEQRLSRLSLVSSWGTSELMWRLDEQKNLLQGVLEDPPSRLEEGIRVKYRIGWFDEALAEFGKAQETAIVDSASAQYIGDIYLFIEKHRDCQMAAHFLEKAAKYVGHRSLRHAVNALMYKGLAHYLSGSKDNPGPYSVAAKSIEEALGVAEQDQEMEYGLQFIPPATDQRNIPTNSEEEGKKVLIVVAEVNQALHFRIFDGKGKIVVDIDEKTLTGRDKPVTDSNKTTLTDQETLIANFKRQLESLRTSHSMTETERAEVITAVRSIVGHVRASELIPELKYQLAQYNVVAGNNTKALAKLRELLVEKPSYVVKVLAEDDFLLAREEILIAVAGAVGELHRKVSEQLNRYEVFLTLALRDKSGNYDEKQFNTFLKELEPITERYAAGDFKSLIQAKGGLESLSMPISHPRHDVHAYTYGGRLSYRAYPRLAPDDSRHPYREEHWAIGGELL
jgi:hypothetical protein